MDWGIGPVQYGAQPGKVAAVRGRSAAEESHATAQTLSESYYFPVAKHAPIGPSCSVGDVRSDGTVWAWGGNTFGQLGDGTTISRLSPVTVQGMACVMIHCLGRRLNATLLCIIPALASQKGSQWATLKPRDAGDCQAGAGKVASTHERLTTLARRAFAVLGSRER